MRYEAWQRLNQLDLRCKAGSMFRPKPSRGREPPHLSHREQQVLNLITQGLSNKEIAERLGIAVTTVSQYLHALFFKLQVQNRTQLAVLAVRLSSKARSAKSTSAHRGDRPEETS